MADGMVPVQKPWRRHEFDAHWERRNSCKYCGHVEAHHNHALPHETLVIDWGRMFDTSVPQNLTPEEVGRQIAEDMFPEASVKHQPVPLTAHVAWVDGLANVCHCPIGHNHGY